MKKPSHISSVPSYDALLRKALHYLERFSASESGVRTVLKRAVYKAFHARGEPLDPESLLLIDQVIATLYRKAYLNDSAFAEGKIRSLLDRGRGVQRIKATLMSKGVDSKTIESALETVLDDHPDAQWEAACTLARKRGLGPFRPEATRQEFWNKDAGILLRGGFPPDLVRRLLSSEQASGERVKGKDQA